MKKKIHLTILLFSLFVLYRTPLVAQSGLSLTAPFEKSKFFLNMSFIMDFLYIHRNLNNDEYNALDIPLLLDNTDLENDHYGFNLNYGELAFQAGADVYFDIFCNLKFDVDDFNVEEVYARANSLPFGFRIKIGRFLSAFGSRNDLHEHKRDFYDQPLVYKAFFGNTGILENGLQVIWKVPVNVDLRIGGEVLEGKNMMSFGTEGFENASISVKGVSSPNILSGFLNGAISIGDFSLGWGASYAQGKARINHNLENARGDALKGKTMLIGADLSLKYTLQSNRYIKIMGEYIYRNIEGLKYLLSDSASTITEGADLEQGQSGIYGQLIIKPFDKWRIGARYDVFLSNNMELDKVKQERRLTKPFRGSAMLEFNPTELSGFRVQYNLDRSLYDSNLRKKETVKEIIVQFNLAIGSHGIHTE